MIEIFLSIGFILVLFLFIYAYGRLSRGWTLKHLFKEFNRKMWMTLLMGGIFFAIYLAIVYLAIIFIPPSGVDLFFLIYRNPVNFIYGGLMVFACFSLSIYIVRMLIKYLYMTRGKDM